MADDIDARTQDWRRFLSAVLAEDEAALREVSERLGGPQGVVLLTCFVGTAIPERFGNDVTLEELSDYAKAISGEVANDPRRIVIEGVLRAGVGRFESLDGFPEDEILAATGLVMRKVDEDLKKSSDFNQAALITRVIDLALLRERACEQDRNMQ